MDSRQPFPFDWSNYGPAHNQQVHGLIGAPQGLASSPSTFEAPFPNPFQADLVKNLQPDKDISMEGNEEEGQSATSVAIAQPNFGSFRRAQSGYLDWNANKDAIWSLYIDQNKSLSETIQDMKNLHSFKASQKLYKIKFKEWGWQKNLSTRTARILTEKAQRRKREEGKDTVFNFGGKLWGRDRIDSTLARVKRSRFDEDLADAETPKDVSYKTPKALVDSPLAVVEEVSDGERDEISDDEPEDIFSDPTDSRPLDGRNLSLTWNGHSRSDLHDMWRTAINHRNAGRSNEAEDMLHQVFLGMGHVLGKTNQDTVKVAYNLADLYAESGRMDEAIAIIEKVIKHHLNTYGYENPRTQQNVLHAVELLNGWNRQADALGLLSLSKELLESSSGAPNVWKADSRPSKKGKAVQRSTQNGSQLEISEAMHSVSEDLTQASVDYGLGVVRAHVAAKDRAAQGLLLAIISQCEDNSEFCVQHIKAQAELLKLYDKFGEADEHGTVFEGALASLDKAWEAYSWDESSIESFDFMEASLQLVANSLKCGYRLQARRMFREASEKASAIFGSDDERTVWVLITIGLVYQTFMTWDDAEEWFEEAFGAALANKQWGPKDGIVRSLQNAMDHHHFSYVSDEGRPFKTIFGVSGIIVSPGRLHLA